MGAPTARGLRRTGLLDDRSVPKKVGLGVEQRAPTRLSAPSSATDGISNTEAINLGAASTNLAD